MQASCVATDSSSSGIPMSLCYTSDRQSGLQNRRGDAGDGDDLRCGNQPLVDSSPTPRSSPPRFSRIASTAVCNTSGIRPGHRKEKQGPDPDAALLACLLWSCGGVTGALNYSFYPHGGPCRDPAPPTVLLQTSPLSPSPADPEEPLALHMMVSEPSHSQLLDLAAALRGHGHRRCMVLIGALRPVGTRRPSDAPQLRGVLIDCEHLVADEFGAFPADAASHGWYACVTGDNMLCFAMHAQLGEADPSIGKQQQQRRRGGGSGPSSSTNTSVLAPAVLPPLPNIGYRLWRRGDVSHALVPRATTVAESGRWDEAIKRFLESSPVV